MPSLVKKLKKAGLITPPDFLEDNICYETLMGSQAYGVADPESSDYDVYSVAVPPKAYIFPHLAGEIFGFDMQKNKFEQYMQHHIVLDKTHEYDVTVYNIVKYFRLCLEGNPNLIDSLFTPNHVILSLSPIGAMIRDNRKLFLSKKCWYTFKGYAFASLSKIKNKENTTNPKRRALIDTWGYDLKFAYHVVRLLDECEQIFIEGDIDLQKNREMLKSIRKGEWMLEDIQNWFDEKERQLEKLYVESKAIPEKIQEQPVKQLLLDCLEHHYGSLEECVVNPDKYKSLVNKIHTLIHEAK
jgi:uncharacterized protein